MAVRRIKQHDSRKARAGHETAISSIVGECIHVISTVSSSLASLARAPLVGRLF